MLSSDPCQLWQEQHCSTPRAAPLLTAWSTASNEVDWNSLTHLCPPFQHTPILCFLFQNLQDSDFSQNSHQCLAAMDTAGTNFLRQAELTLLWEKPSTTRILEMLHGVPSNYWQLIRMSHSTQHKRKKIEYKHWIKNQLGFRILFLVTQAHVLSLVIFISSIKTHIGIKT